MSEAGTDTATPKKVGFLWPRISDFQSAQAVAKQSSALIVAFMVVAPIALLLLSLALVGIEPIAALEFNREDMIGLGIVLVTYVIISLLAWQIISRKKYGLIPVLSVLAFLMVLLQIATIFLGGASSGATGGMAFLAGLQAVHALRGWRGLKHYPETIDADEIEATAFD